MQIIRTIIWVVIAALLVTFIMLNLTPVPVVLSPKGLGDLAVDWPVGIIAVAFFLAGLLPMWLFSKAGRWRLKRRIAALENSVRAATTTQPLSHGEAAAQHPDDNPPHPEGQNAP